MCKYCDKNEIEDEFHFVINCKRYKNIRVKYLNPFYYVRPSMFKFISLLKSVDEQIFFNLAKYIKEATHIRLSCDYICLYNQLIRSSSLLLWLVVSWFTPIIWYYNLLTWRDLLYYIVNMTMYNVCTCQINVLFCSVLFWWKHAFGYYGNVREVTIRLAQ